MTDFDYLPTLIYRFGVAVTLSSLLLIQLYQLPADPSWFDNGLNNLTAIGVMAMVIGTILTGKMRALSDAGKRLQEELR